MPVARGAALSVATEYWAGGADRQLLRRMLRGAAQVGFEIPS